ncbi:hypothetical protein B0H16DRAFT_1901144 [Mycena metata]|uniref:Uncharacterized protein n=1 Tax=Mycena metata TaxID=1033252 RepID=A0AAD7GZF0_9AGAR|nr:hypothetical protein B0H16DRAFT_1901144 [Mycena metata]
MNRLDLLGLLTLRLSVHAQSAPIPDSSPSAVLASARVPERDVVTMTMRRVDLFGRALRGRGRAEEKRVVDGVSSSSKNLSEEGDEGVAEA